MSKVLVTESHLNNIAEAIRSKNGASTTYRPGDMAAAIQAIPTGGITPTGTKNIAQNGTHDVTQYASANVNVQPNLQSKTATQNGTVTPDQGYDGLSSVLVDVSGGRGAIIDSFAESTWLISANLNNNRLTVIISKEVSRSNYQPPLNTTYAPNITFAEWLTLLDSNMFYRFEHFDNVDANFIAGAGLVLLGDFSQGGADVGNILTDSINNYSAVILNGIYSKQSTSAYNTCIVYKSPALNTAYWAGMKDRNPTYDCNVTFTDANTVSLSGNKQVIIYGIP